MVKLVSLGFYQVDRMSASGEQPLAMVRSAIFDVEDKPVDIQQIEYPDTPEGLDDFEENTISALESDIDTTIMTCKDVKEFKNLHAYLESVEYYTNRPS